MKFLEIDAVEQLNTFLSSMDPSASRLYGRLEIYSCKKQKEDRKLKDYMNTRFEKYIADESAPAVPPPHLMGRRNSTSFMAGAGAGSHADRRDHQAPAEDPHPPTASKRQRPIGEGAAESSGAELDERSSRDDGRRSSLGGDEATDDASGGHEVAAKTGEHRRGSSSSGGGGHASDCDEIGAHGHPPTDTDSGHELSSPLRAPHQIAGAALSSPPQPTRPWAPQHGYFHYFFDYAKSQPQPLPADHPMAKKLVAQFVGTMNLAFPDYDFSDLRPHQFMLIPFAAFATDLDTRLQPLGDATRRAVKQRLFATVRFALSPPPREPVRRGKKRERQEVEEEKVEDVSDVFTWTPESGEEPGSEEGLL